MKDLCRYKQISETKTYEGKVYMNGHPEIPFKICKESCKGNNRQCKYFELNPPMVSKKDFTLDDLEDGNGLRLTSAKLLGIIFLMAVLLISSLPLVLSQVESLGTFIVDKNVTLKQTCANCTSVNITTVLYPNSSTAIQNVQMTKQGSDYFYQFKNTSAVGRYIVNGIGDVDGIPTVFSYDFYINEGGHELSTAQGIMYIVAFAVAIFMFTICLIITTNIPLRNNKGDDGNLVSINKLKYLKIFMIPITYMFFVMIVALARSVIASYLYTDIANVSTIFNWVYWIMMSAILPIIVLSFVFVIVFFVEDKVLGKKLKRRHYR